jgi:hypothetical protein
VEGQSNINLAWFSTSKASLKTVILSPPCPSEASIHCRQQRRFNAGCMFEKYRLKKQGGDLAWLIYDGKANTHTAYRSEFSPPSLGVFIKKT